MGFGRWAAHPHQTFLGVPQAPGIVENKVNMFFAGLDWSFWQKLCARSSGWQKAYI